MALTIPDEVLNAEPGWGPSTSFLETLETEDHVVEEGDILLMVELHANRGGTTRQSKWTILPARCVGRGGVVGEKLEDVNRADRNSWKHGHREYYLLGNAGGGA